ncbi:MAG TPA: hypothetical protein VMT20_27635 [Terriglobia bacterium]|nr:hypothetical protein [Terriglobia bacterium]
MRTCVRWAFIISSTFFLAVPARSQSLGNADTVDSSVVNQSGAAIATVAYHLKIKAPGIRTDSLLLAEGARRRVASVQLENLTNNVALDNFLSTFSGTHLLQPRMLVSRIGFNGQPRSTWGRFGGSQTPAGESRPGRVMQFGLRCAF